MTATEFHRAMVSAKDYDNPDDRIAIIKRAVTSEVRAADPTVQPRFTEYFNHSIAPDIVLQWPNENRERLLFVRPTAHADWLLNDMRFLSKHRPLVFALEDLASSQAIDRTDNAVQSLGRAATEAGTWITDSTGTEAIASVRQQSPTLALLSQALVRGGRGISGSEEIQDLTDATEAGFAGASRLSSDETASAVRAIERHLEPDQSGRLTRLLRAVWEAHGGDQAQFPPTATVGNLTADDLSFLLKTATEGSPDFWRRIGRAVSTEMLGQTQVDDPSAGLQVLMSTNLEVLQAKGVRLLYEPLRLAESEQVPRWLVSKGCLALRGRNWTAYVAARRTEEFPPSDPPQPLDLATLRRRAQEGPTRITQVRIGQGEREFIYESMEGGNVLGHPGLAKAALDLGVSDIQGVVAAIPGGGNVNVDFSTNTAAGPTSATFLLGALMRFALPLLSDLAPDEREAVAQWLRGYGYQDTLFAAANDSAGEHPVTP
ncbi:MAG TPA: hypothetical protein VMA72_14165 [Streptosporangiaceae bacterium]|nr:hypothetical protein [Streptosporangiaceae bacterium]